MKRLGLAVAVVVAVAAAAPAVASAETITPVCTTAQGTSQCGGGWYQTPVLELSWVWSTGGTPGDCNQHAYQSDAVANVSCTVSWSNGFVGTQSYTVHVETSSPAATVAPSRSPDSGGWYNHGVTGTVSAHSFSGPPSCASSTYSGPSSTAATVFATCVDPAGKRVTVISAPFAYDVTPPALNAAADPADHSVALSWQTGGDLAPTVAVRVARRRAGSKAAIIYNGNGGGCVDTHVHNDIRYTYTITAWDQAGNASSRTVVVTPGPRLLGPVGGARVTAPPMLGWTPVRGATYYNVQLYRRGNKLLSVWPGHGSLQLRRSWKFEGHRYHLKPGRYRWYVWPGFGRRSAARYGRMIGPGTFIVVR